MNPISFTKSVLLFVLFFLTSFAFSSPASSAECGDIIGPGGHHSLEKDLDCVEPITVIGPAVFNLKGHTIDGSRNGPPYYTIIVEGKGAKVFNGFMYGCRGTCIVAGGSGHHSFSHLKIDEGYSGISIESNYNKIYRNTVSRADWAIYVSGKYNFLFRNKTEDNYGEAYVIGGSRNYLLYNSSKTSYSIGFWIGGNENRLIKNISSESVAFSGFHITGSKNTFKYNKAISNRQSGFQIFNDQNKLIANRAELNQKHGIEVTSLNNTIKRNTGIDNGDGASSFDLFELSNDCEGNTWKNNYFYTANQECIK